MELKIYSPSEDGFLKAIEWNHEEIKKEIAERVKIYSELIYSEEQIKNAKTDRATLNKFIQALEAKRKEVKKQCLAPYEEFEKKMKEIVAIVNEPIILIDGQIKDFERKKVEEKRNAIDDIWQKFLSENRVPEGIGIYHIFNEKWLNASVKLSTIEKEINEKLEQIEKDLATLQNLPEFSFEAIEVYKDTLDINKAIQEGQRLSEMQKRKAECEKAKENAKASLVNCGIASDGNEAAESIKTAEMQFSEPKTKIISFRCWLTVENAKELKQFFESRNIKFEAIK